MKSFQVTEFNAPLTEVDQPTPQPGSADVTNTATADATVCAVPMHATATATAHVWGGPRARCAHPVHSAITSNFNGIDIPAGPRPG